MRPIYGYRFDESEYSHVSLYQRPRMVLREAVIDDHETVVREAIDRAALVSGRLMDDLDCPDARLVVREHPLGAHDIDLRQHRWPPECR